METMKAKVVNIYNKHHHILVVFIGNHVLPNTVELHGYGKPRVNVGDIALILMKVR